LTAKNITKFGTVALAANDLSVTAVACAVYDGTEWQLQNPQGTLTPASLLATGIVDGQAPITVETGSFSFSSTYHTGYYIINNGSTATTGTLLAASAGNQYCVRNIAGGTSAITIQTSASGQYIDNAGGYTASGGYVISGGALGDAACIVAIDTTHWLLYISSGTWTTH
jgi:hypothetical protein